MTVLHAIAVIVVASVLSAASGYAFRGRIRKEIGVAGTMAKSDAQAAAQMAQGEVKKL